MEADDNIHRTEKRRRLCCGQHRTTTPPLPTDLMLEIARRTDDPVTIARCAATCKELRRHIADPSFGSCRLRLRHGDRFAAPSLLLRGQLVNKWGNDLYLEDNTTAADGTKKPIATGCFQQGGSQFLCKPMAARGGLVLVLVRVITVVVRVCNPATGRFQSLPPGATFRGQYVLLVGDGDGGGVVGRPFKVLKAGTVRSRRRRRCSLLVQTFSSERGAWGPCTKIPSPFETTCSSLSPPPRHLVVGDAVRWLCRYDNSYYVLKLRVGAGDGEDARLTMTKLPPSFHRECELRRARTEQMLLATTYAGGSPIVLVANDGRISAWTLSGRKVRWTNRPHVVVEDEAFGLRRLRLEWFAERSGIVMLSTSCRRFFWFDLQSWKIVRHYLGSYGPRNRPYEIEAESTSWDHIGPRNWPYEIEAGQARRR